MKTNFFLLSLGLFLSDPAEARDFMVIFKSKEALRKVYEKVPELEGEILTDTSAANPILLVDCGENSCKWFKTQKKHIVSTEEDVTVQIDDPPVNDIPVIHPPIGHQSKPSNWGQDRIDGKLDNDYNMSQFTGEGVDIFIIDTGTWAKHSDFSVRERKNGETGRWVTKSRVQAGVDLTGSETVPPAGNVDCHGHGTHVASIAAGKKYGIATSANIIPVKVLGCNGRGWLSTIIKGITWSVNYKPTPGYNRRKIISMSLGGDVLKQTSRASIQNAVKNGINVVVAAGNSNLNACRFDPAYVPEAITVGSTDLTDRRSSFSNYGECVDIFAPGTDIVAASTAGSKASISRSGTSMSAPFVSGVIALIRERYPSMDAEQVRNVLENSWSQAGIVTNAGFKSNNLYALNKEFRKTSTPYPTPSTVEQCSCD